MAEPTRSSRTRSRRPTCSPDPARRSWRSSAPGASAGSPARWSAGADSSCRASSSSSCSRRCSWPARLRPGSAAPVPARAPRSPPSRCRPAERCCVRAGARERERSGRAGAPTSPPALRRRPSPASGSCSCCSSAGASSSPARPPADGAAVGLHALAAGRGRRRNRRAGRAGWMAFKVGALSYGGGFVIIPLMQADAVDTLPLDDQRPSSSTRSRSARSRRARWCRPSPSSATPRPASAARCSRRRSRSRPSFSFILIGADRFDRLRQNARVRAFLDGAGPAAIGAILGRRCRSRSP